MEEYSEVALPTEYRKVALAPTVMKTVLKFILKSVRKEAIYHVSKFAGKVYGFKYSREVLLTVMHRNKLLNLTERWFKSL